MPHPQLELSPGEVHVWRVSLNPSDEWRLELFAQLGPEERKRAASFRLERDCRHFIVCRGALRVLLGRYLRMAPDQIVLGAGPKGKPYLAVRDSRRPLHFNVSHSGGVALIAFALGREVGIDVEQKRSIGDLEALAEYALSQREHLAWRVLPESQRPDAFFSCWSRKEAFSKAIGMGLALPLDSFDVSLAPGEPAALLRVAGDPQAPSRWTMAEIPMEPEYAAAIVVEGPECHLQTLSFDSWFVGQGRPAAA